MKLKTLNDLDKGTCECENEDMISYLELKEEVIKWIKQFEEDKKECICSACDEGIGPCQIDFLINWIKDFFNITKEELK